MLQLMSIGLGGFAGAVARYLLDGWVSDRTAGQFPFGTLAVNLIGSFLLGLLFAVTVDRSVLPAELRAPLGVGFIGAFTTFSTLMLESWRLVEGGAAPLAALNLAGSVALGLMAVVAGLAIGRAV
jgi:fluoride exporter